MNDQPQVQFPTMKGVNTWAARGSTEQPYLLENALLRPGGWACAPASRTRADNVLFAVWSGVAQDMYIQRSNGQVVRVVDGAEYLLPVPLGTTLRNAVRLGPNLLQLGDQYLTGDKAVSVAQNVVEWEEGQPQPSGPYYKQGSGEVRTYAIVPIQGENRVGRTHPYVTPQYIQSRDLPTFGGFDYHVVIYQQLLGKWYYVATSAVSYDAQTTVITSQTFSPSAGLPPPIEQEHMTVDVALADYHQGRVFYTARSAKAGMNWQPPAPLDIPPNRLFFSDVVLGFSDTVLPQYAQDYYFDVPFRVSSRITALQSVGRYLYVFGERELLLLTGYDDTSWQFESLGDSVGTVAPQSVQQLRGSMFYLSDGDVLMVQGGQIQSVGGDVRDLLLGLNLSAVTATVDFEQELYYLTDGDTCLVFHAQLGGWTTRAIEGRAERLLNGAGKPWALISTDEGNRLVTFDAPELLPLKVKVGPFGGPRTRRMWRSVALLLDTDAPARVDVALTGRDMDMGGQVQDTDTDPAAVMGAAGLTPVSLTLGRDGAGVTASLCWATLTVTPDPQARRCLLRGPLDFGGGSVKEAMNQ